MKPCLALHAWLCAQHCCTCQPGAQRSTFPSQPQRRQLVQLLWLANPADVSQHCSAPIPAQACPHPLWGWGVLVTTTDVPLLHSPALPLQQHYGSIPAGLRETAQRRWAQGISGKVWDVICMQKMAYSSFSTPTNSSSALCLPRIPLLHLGSAWGKQ